MRRARSRLGAARALSCRGPMAVAGVDFDSFPVLSWLGNTTPPADVAGRQHQAPSAHCESTQSPRVQLLSILIANPHTGATHALVPADGSSEWEAARRDSRGNVLFRLTRLLFRLNEEMRCRRSWRGTSTSGILSYRARLRGHATCLASSSRPPRARFNAGARCPAQSKSL